MEFDYEKQIKELKSELEGKEEMSSEAIFQLQTKIGQLQNDNQSLNDQIIQMEGERFAIDKLLRTALNIGS